MALAIGVVAVILIPIVIFSFGMASLLKFGSRRRQAALQRQVAREAARQAAVQWPATGARTQDPMQATNDWPDALRQQGRTAHQSLSARLAELDAARQAGQITEAEYTARRTAIIQSS